MDFSVDRCRRRAATRRSLVYLDSSTFDAIAKRDEAAVEITDALNEALKEEQAICVCSPWHEDELALMQPGPTLNAVVRVVRTYTRELQMRPDSELMSAERYRGSTALLGRCLTQNSRPRGRGAQRVGEIQAEELGRIDRGSMQVTM